MFQQVDTPVPDTFIVGAPKCGTTSLYDWLSQHPDVFMSPFKEPRYFCHDLTFYFRYNHPADYLGLFGAAEGYKRVGEASTSYLASRRAPYAIRQASCSEVRIIMSLRDPVEMVPSWHGQLVRMGNEPIENFEEAWNAVSDRRNGRKLPERVNPWEGLFYTDIARYADHVQRYQSVFEPHELKIVLFEDLVSQTEEIWAELCEFLNIEPVDVSFRKANPHTQVRSHWVRETLRDPPSLVKGLMEKVPLRWRLRLRALARTLNTEESPRDPLKENIKRRVGNHYSDQIARLERILDRDLSHWGSKARNERGRTGACGSGETT